MPEFSVKVLTLSALLVSAWLTTCRGQTVVKGVGSTFAGNVYLRWISAYKAARGLTDLTMTYDLDGSGAGKAAMETAPGADQTMAYGASDTPLTVTEFDTYPDLQTLPTMAGWVTSGRPTHAFIAV